VLDLRQPIAILEINPASKNGTVKRSSEPVYGGYANARGEINLFAETGTYRVNFKNQTLRQRPALNAGAQANYDAVEAGEQFVYAKTDFLRLSNERIAEICAMGAFRVMA
jgi:hypothetical protein